MIDKRQIKYKYTRFKQWQQEPLKYVNCDDVHFCNNCGLMFAGNFCPRCSQKADIGRISWKRITTGPWTESYIVMNMCFNNHIFITFIIIPNFCSISSWVFFCSTKNNNFLF